MSVYFARVKGYVKIGYSAKPWERVSTITTGSSIKPDDVTYGDEVHLLGWIPGDRKVEKSMHKRFASLRVEGEWFWDDDAFDALIVDHDFGIPWPGSSWDLVVAMKQYPTIPRVKVQEALDELRAKELADPNSNVSQLRSLIGFDDEWVAQQERRLYAERRADREFWREQRWVS